MAGQKSIRLVDDERQREHVSDREVDARQDAQHKPEAVSSHLISPANAR